MLRGSNPGLWISLIVLLLFSGCAKAPVYTEQFESTNDEATVAPVVQPALKTPSSAKASVKPAGKDLSTVRRLITEKEVRKLQAKDPDLEFYRCIEILCRLNKKDKEYIRADMKHKRPLTVPKNFSSYKNWSPLPRNIASAGKLPKLILLVKNISFLGWYQNGRLVDDTYVCIGKMNTWTKKGIYSVKAKDPDHMSTYPNAYGYPAYMPNALHIYGRVWIHTGDVIGPHCSHGCINVPIDPADKLFDWTNAGTAVLITESLKDLGRDIKIARLDKRNPQKALLVEEKGKQDNRQKSAKETPKQFPGNSSKVTTGGI
jgi:lipoprotein-anchoring transpeptidase ErfK/SrfK